MNFTYYLNIEKYRSAGSIWPGILRYVRETQFGSAGASEESVSEKELSKWINKEAQKILIEQDADGQPYTKDFDTFRKAMSNLKNGKTLAIKKDNLFRLLFVLHISSDTEAQHLLSDYLHINELSARILEDFLVLSALHLQLSWSETKKFLYEKYADLVKEQNPVPDNADEGYTAIVYSGVIDRLHSVQDLTNYLDTPLERAAFARSSNTRYLALFYEVTPEAVPDRVTGKTLFRLSDPEGNNITVTQYREEFFRLGGNCPEDALTIDEINALSEIFEDIFLDAAEFDALVHRHRTTDVSPGTFIISFLNRLDAEDEDFEFYVNFFEPDDFRDALDDWLLYYGFPLMNPDCSSFERLLLDIHSELLLQVNAADLQDTDDFSNADFFEEYLRALRYYLRALIA